MEGNRKLTSVSWLSPLQTWHNTDPVSDTIHLVNKLAVQFSGQSGNPWKFKVKLSDQQLVRVGFRV